MTVQSDDLASYVGQEAEPPRVARYDVNSAMIRNWVEAHDDHNPVYVDAEAVRATGRKNTPCPPAMISTWVMSGLRRYREVQQLREEGRTEDSAYSRLLATLDLAGYSSVVATDVQQSYVRELYPGDRVTAFYTIESISPVKQTALGEGRFITLLKHYCNQHNDLVCEERFRMLRFRPATPQADS